MDKSNCDSAGDLICDTDASPVLSGLVNNNCEYTGVGTDNNGDYYLPSVANHMSYSLPKCRCSFTSDQYNWMLNYYWSHIYLLH